MLKCKACGFIIDEAKLGDACPACGVPRTAFETFVDHISHRRRQWLNQHVHQIAVEFPQSFVTFLLFVSVGSFVMNSYPEIQIHLAHTAKILAFFLPLAVLGALFTGFIDGKVRFKKVTTHLLKIKIVAGLSFLIFSISLALVIFTYGISQDTILYIIILNLFALVCSFVLGKKGSSLTCAEMGGK